MNGTSHNESLRRKRLRNKYESFLALLPTGTVLLCLSFVEARSNQRPLFASLGSNAFLIQVDPTSKMALHAIKFLIHCPQSCVHLMRRRIPVPLAVGTRASNYWCNPAFLRTLARTADAIVEEHIFTAFLSIQRTRPPQRLTKDALHIERAIAAKLPDMAPFLRYAVSRKSPQGTTF